MFLYPVVALFFGVCVAGDGFNLFVVAFYDLRYYVTYTTVADLCIVFMFLLIRFRKSLPMSDVSHLLSGGLNQVVFLFLCFLFAFCILVFVSNRFFSGVLNLNFYFLQSVCV